MKKNRLSKFFASIAAAGTIAMAALFPFSAKAQQSSIIPTNQTDTFTGIVNLLIGTGNGISNGESVNGSITFNPSSFTLGAGNGSTTPASVYYDPTALVSVDVGGNTTVYQGIVLGVSYNVPDGNNIPSDGISIGWGPGYNDGVIFNYPLGDISDSSLASGLKEINEGTNNTLPGDAIFGVGSDNSGFNGAQGNISSFGDPVATPEPSTYGLGAVGLAALFGFQWRRFIPGNQQTEPSIKG